MLDLSCSQCVITAACTFGLLLVKWLGVKERSNLCKAFSPSVGLFFPSFVLHLNSRVRPLIHCGEKSISEWVSERVEWVSERVSECICITNSAGIGLLTGRKSQRLKWVRKEGRKAESETQKNRSKSHSDELSWVKHAMREREREREREKEKEPREKNKSRAGWCSWWWW